MINLVIEQGPKILWNGGTTFVCNLNNYRQKVYFPPMRHIALFVDILPKIAKFAIFGRRKEFSSYFNYKHAPIYWIITRSRDSFS